MSLSFLFTPEAILNTSVLRYWVLLVSLLVQGCKDPPGDPILIIDLVGDNSNAADISALGFSPQRIELLISETAASEPQTFVVPDSSGKVLTLTFDANNSARDTVTLFSPRPGFLHQVRFIEDSVTVSGSAAPNGTATAKVPSGPQTGIKISPADGVPFELQREKSTRIEVLIDVGHQINRPGKVEFHFKPSLSATLVESARSPAILPDRVVVRFHDGVTLSRINELIAESGSTVLNSDRTSNYYVLKIPSTSSLEGALEFYESKSEIRFTLPDNVIHSRQLRPCDPIFQNPGPFTQTNATFAWQVTTGRRQDALLADIDNGFDMTSPDMVPNYAINQGELLGVRFFDRDADNAVTAAEVLAFDTDADGLITFVDLNAPAMRCFCSPGFPKPTTCGLTCDRDADNRITPLDLLDGVAGDVGFEDGLDNDDLDGDPTTFIDDLVGWDFTPPGDNLPGTAGPNSCTGAHGVGTSGIISSVGAAPPVGGPGVCASGLGVGMNWASQLIPIQWPPNGITDTDSTRSGAYLAIRYAVSRGADAINASWGQTFNQGAQVRCGSRVLINNLGSVKYGKLLTRLQDEADSMALGNSVLVVAAEDCAQNDDLQTTFDWPVELAPSAGDNVLSVTSVNATNGLPAQRAFGPNTIDIAAPGENHALLGIASTTNFGCSGTSFAAPMVTGTIGLLLANAANPPIRGTAATVISRLLCNATVVPGLAGQVGGGGRVLDTQTSVNNTNACP